MIFLPMEFGHKLQRTLHLHEGENGAADVQHLHQSRWARESKSLDNHLLLPCHLVMIRWKTNSLAVYLQRIRIGIIVWSLVCNLYILMLAGIFMPSYFDLELNMVYYAIPSVSPFMYSGLGIRCM